MNGGRAGGSLRLGIPGFSYEDLHEPLGLERLYAAFVDELAARAPDLHADYLAYRECRGDGMEPVAVSELLVALAPQVGEFVARLFGVSAERERQRAAVRAELESVFAFRSEIVASLGKHFRDVDTSGWDPAAIGHRLELLIRGAFPDLADDADAERRVASAAMRLHRLASGAGDGDASGAGDGGASGAGEASASELGALRRRVADSAGADAFADDLKRPDGELAGALLEHLRRWAWLARTDSGLKAQVADWVSFKEPEKRDFDALVAHDVETRDGYAVWKGLAATRRRRDGFGLTGKRHGRRRILYEIDHCIYCHDRDTDSCSKGMRNRKDGSYKTNPLGASVTGCPLEEKISEMHFVKRQGDSIGALALVVIDNPMCAGTGYSICNDCTKGCIYQKTEPVDIPQIETSVLTDVLFMPYGFEIYSLLTRWNPLNVRRPHAVPYHGLNALVVGLGPAGYTLAHYLLNEGFSVVGIDALKIEPLPEELIGDGVSPPEPIEDYAALYEKLDERALTGFGGVAEYGITVRWDKNFLKVIYLLLARRAAFRSYGGVRFGGTLTIEDAWQLGFHHIAICAGAGRPTVIGIENNLIRGVRQATDFLMALQLTGASRKASLVDLQVRLPAGIIGGGLTSIDTATECAAYYPLQVERTLERYERIAAEIGEARLRDDFDAEEIEILDEFLAHGRAVRDERRRAAAAGETPDFQRLVDGWGGVTLFYRKRIEASPAYRQNHEEIHKALDEGVVLAPNLNPVRAVADRHGHLCAVRFRKTDVDAGAPTDADAGAGSDSGTRTGAGAGAGDEIELPLRSLFIAAGTSPNVSYEQEHPGTFEMDGKYFQRYEPAWVDGKAKLEPMHDTLWPKIGKPAPFTSYRRNGRYISFFGDDHPVYTGTVVKAMASAKHGYPAIAKLHEAEIRAAEAEIRAADDETGQRQRREASRQRLFARLDELLLAELIEVRRLAPSVVELVARAPMAAGKFEPGHLYRVEPLETAAPGSDERGPEVEGLALPGLSADAKRGTISLVAVESNASSRLCADWKPGRRIVVMGPTGAAAPIHPARTVLLAGDGPGNAVALAIARALRAAGSRIVYFAGYRSAADTDAGGLQAAADVVVRAVDEPAAAPPTRAGSGERVFVGGIVDAIEAYAGGELGPVTIPLDEVDDIIAIGTDRMMASVKEARRGRLVRYLKPGHAAVGVIDSPMQCMMKGVCARCLCRHVDPDSGREFFVYSCADQHQRLDSVDFDNLSARLRQNSVQRKLSNRWLDLLRSGP